MAILNEPKYESAYLNLGDIYFALKNYEDALKTFKEAELLTSCENEYLYLRKAEIYEDLNQLSDAIEYNEKALKFAKKMENILEIKK